MDGHLDGHALLSGYRAKALDLGARFAHDEVTEVTCSSSRPGRARRVTGVRLASGGQLATGVVVNCAGAWAAGVARTVGVELPVRPVVRQVFVVEPAVRPEAPLPLVNLPSGLYFRSEAEDRILVGKSLPDDPESFELTWSESRFNEHLWPELAVLVPSFDRLRLRRAWAGLYAVNSLDGNAILGPWPDLEGLWLANGFSGHGLQQAPAVGRYLAERISGRQPTLDLAIFGARRILEGRPLEEGWLV